jgi:hypothetical protein
MSIVSPAVAARCQRRAKRSVTFTKVGKKVLTCVGSSPLSTIGRWRFQASPFDLRTPPKLSSRAVSPNRVVR